LEIEISRWNSNVPAVLLLGRLCAATYGAPDLMVSQISQILFAL
jgi:hypothetical protein